MKRAAITIFLLMFFWVSPPLSALAQEVAVNVSARVTSSVELITIQSMNLAHAEPENDFIRVNPQNSAGAGKMIAIGTPDSDIRISFLETRELARRGGPETLLFNYTVAGNTIDDQSTAEILSQDNRDFEFNGKGRFYIWVGGSVDISTATPGSYQGEFTIDITYI